MISHQNLALSYRVAAIQMVSTPVLAENLDVAAHLIAKAVESGAGLVALPEYFCCMGQTEFDKLAIREEQGSGPIQEFLAGQAQRYGICIVGGTLALISPDNGRVYNTIMAYGPQGQRLARYDKIHLFYFEQGSEQYDESRTLCPGREVVVFDAPCGRVGLSICYDLRFPELYRAMGLVNLMVVPAAFTYSTGKAHWEILLRARAIENQCYVLAPAQGGVHSNGRHTWGHSMLVDPWGEVIDMLSDGPGIVSGNIEIARLTEVRTALPAHRHRVM